MDIPITHTITVIATTPMATFPSIMIPTGFIISVGVTTRLAIGEEDTDPFFFKGHNEGASRCRKQNRIRRQHLDEMIKSHASGYIH